MSVSLSSLNRAALAAREMYWWINGIAVVLSLMIAKMSWGAYAAAKAPDKALICITCQLLAIAAAVLARRAFTGQMPVMGFISAAGALGCAWWASHGLALAWATGGDTANSWMVFFLAAFEPLLFLVAEQIREGRQALRAAQAKADAETEEELKRIRERDAAHMGVRLATMGGVALTVATPGAHGATIPPVIAQPSAHLTDRAPIVSENTGHPTARAHVEALMAQGITKRVELHRRTGVPLSTISRWAREIEEKAA